MHLPVEIGWNCHTRGNRRVSASVHGATRVGLLERDHLDSEKKVKCGVKEDGMAWCKMAILVEAVGAVRGRPVIDSLPKLLIQHHR